MAYTELSGSASMAYAEALESVMTREASASSGDGFGFVKKSVTRGDHWYLQHTLAGKKKQYYFGPDNEEIRGRIAQQKARWDEGKADTAQVEKLVAMALAAGCAGISHRAYKVLYAAEQAGLFRAGGVLVGSFAFLAMGNMLGVSWRRDTTATQDIDLAASDEAMVAIPENARPLGDVILDSETGLLSVPMLNPRAHSTSFKIRGGSFRVDLVTPRKGKPEGQQYVRAIQSYAEPVAFLEYLLEDTQKAVLLHKGGVLVNVPNPARFALHKLVVARRRPASQRTKATKDVKQATQLLTCLLDQNPGDVWLALDAALSHPSRKFRDTLRAGIQSLDVGAGLKARLAEIQG
ncbi:GSU2403 family nucleotidyltransferase fold protein [Seongchinamella unica]|nr:GSU2403 family nucleotidyltransferase fold protein [Seongchinamella unica]